MYLCVCVRVFGMCVFEGCIARVCVHVCVWGCMCVSGVCACVCVCVCVCACVCTAWLPLLVLSKQRCPGPRCGGLCEQECSAIVGCCPFCRTNALWSICCPFCRANALWSMCCPFCHTKTLWSMCCPKLLHCHHCLMPAGLPAPRGLQYKS